MSVLFSRSSRLAVAVFLTVCAARAEPIFTDPFEGDLKPGWSWIRPKAESRRTTPNGLEIRIEPGNMWGPANDARNVLVRPLPDASTTPVTVEVTVSNRPTEQYEQVDLVWYQDDSHQVKIGQELVDGQLSIVMGREERDRIRTLAIIPIDAFTLELRLVIEGDQIRGYFRPEKSQDWTKAGECDLPGAGPARIAIQCYQGPGEREHWARLRSFRIDRLQGG